MEISLERNDDVMVLSLQGRLDVVASDKVRDEIVRLLELPAIKTLQEQQKIEGWIYPDTYNYTPNSTDLALLQAWICHRQGWTKSSSRAGLVSGGIVPEGRRVMEQRGGEVQWEHS